VPFAENYLRIVLNCPSLCPELIPALLARTSRPAACEMHEQVSFLPLHKIRAFGKRVDGALFDYTKVFPEGFVVTDKV
jgi:hypothetical protein